MKIRILISILGIIISCLSACSQDPKNSIYGNWKQVDRDIILVFRDFTSEDPIDHSKIDNINGVVQLICTHNTVDGYYRWENHDSIILYLNVVHDECFEDHLLNNIEDSQFHYYIDELTHDKLVLRNAQSPENITEYLRVVNPK